MAASSPFPASPIFPSRLDIARIARDAGALTLTYFRRHASQAIRVDEKADDQGLVTEADLATEAFVRACIRERFPGHAVLGEEEGWSGLPGGHPLSHQSSGSKEGGGDTGRSDGTENAEPLPVWIVDPIDGTTNFSNGNPFYCVSIGFALVQNGRATLQAAAICHPLPGDVYSAVRGEGAFVNDEPMRVNPETRFARASFATGFSSNKGQALCSIARAIERVQDQTIGLRVNGAAALDLAFTSRGILHGFFERALKPWDLAAGVLLVQEAGATVTNVAGEPFDVLRDDNVLCANASLHSQLGSVLREIGY